MNNQSSAPQKRLSERCLRRLLRLARAGDEAARDQIIRAHLGYVASIARRFHRQGSFFDLGDLVQQGCLGLLKAMTKFDLNRRKDGRSARFSTYASYWIEHYVRREIEVRGRTIAVPSNVQYFLQHRARARWAERAGLAGSIDFEQAAKKWGLSSRRAQSLHSLALETISLETLTDDPERSPATASFLVRDASHDPVREELRTLLSTLLPRERFVIEQRHGLGNGEGPKVLKQVGDLLGISPERVRQIEQRALERMRRASEQSPLNGGPGTNGLLKTGPRSR